VMYTAVPPLTLSLPFHIKGKAEETISAMTRVEIRPPLGLRSCLWQTSSPLAPLARRRQSESVTELAEWSV